MLRDGGHRVGAVVAVQWVEASGVNSRAELAMVETLLQQRVISRLMEEGVTFRNPNTVVIDSTVSVERDTVIYPFVTLEGRTHIGPRCVVEPGVHLINA